MFDVWKSLSPPLNINKQLTAVANTDKREINCGDRHIWTEGERGEKSSQQNQRGEDGKVGRGRNGEGEEKKEELKGEMR